MTPGLLWLTQNSRSRSPDVFGALAPLPLRLTGNGSEIGVSTAQYLRLVADLVAVRRTVPIANITFTQGGAIHAYHGWNSCDTADAPTVASGGTGISTITFPAYFEDPHGIARRISITGARATADGSTPYVILEEFTGNNVITVTTTTILGVATDIKMTLRIYGTVGDDYQIDDYGGDPDKIDTEDETTPYAWSWYLEFEDMLGSAFTKNRTGLVHCQKLALARLYGAGIQRAIERFTNNCVPATSSDLLPTWAQCFGVQTGPSTPDWEVRRDCSVRMKLLTGCTPDAIDAAVGELFGDYLVAVHRNNTNDLDDPPENTFWPNGDPGDSSYSLCGYQWSSGRCHVWVEVSWPPGLSTTQFLQLMDVKYFRLMDMALPAHATFAWDLDSSTGFLIGISQLGFDAL